MCLDHTSLKKPNLHIPLSADLGVGHPHFHHLKNGKQHPWIFQKEPLPLPLQVPRQCQAGFCPPLLEYGSAVWDQQLKKGVNITQNLKMCKMFHHWELQAQPSKQPSKSQQTRPANSTGKTQIAPPPDLLQADCMVGVSLKNPVHYSK